MKKQGLNNRIGIQEVEQTSTRESSRSKSFATTTIIEAKTLSTKPTIAGNPTNNFLCKRSQPSDAKKSRTSIILPTPTSNGLRRWKRTIGKHFTTIWQSTTQEEDNYLESSGGNRSVCKMPHQPTHYLPDQSREYQEGEIEGVVCTRSKNASEARNNPHDHQITKRV
jgi:hypothetical protein